MATSKNSVYEFGLPYIIMQALNPDYSNPEPDNVLGGIGPFDFSSAADHSDEIPMTVVIDLVKTNLLLDLSAVDLTLSAITASELVAAITTAAAAASPAAEITASVDSTSLRVKLIATTEGAVNFQVYGEAAIIAGFGQGFGTKLLFIETGQSADGTPIMKESERISTTNARGIDTEIITDGYVKGSTETIVDVAKDLEIAGLMNGTYSDGSSLRSGVEGDIHPVFRMKYYYAKYMEGQNDEASIFGYREKYFGRCKGSLGDDGKKREFSTGNYTVETKTWVDSSGTKHDAWTVSDLTVSEFEALKLYALGELSE